MLIPGSLYPLFLLLANALTDAVRQLTSTEYVLSGALARYYNREILLGILTGYVCARLALGEHQARFPGRERWLRWIGLLALSIVPVLGVALTLLTDKFILPSSFGLFGMATGAVCHFIVDKPPGSSGRTRTGLLVLMTAWSISLSSGYVCPVLASGQLLSVLLAFAYPEILKRTGRRVLVLSLAICTVLLLSSFGVLRVNHVYKDQSARKLTRELGGVLPGGKWIRTNPNTYEALVDLRNAISIALDLGDTFSVLVDYAGYWVRSSEINELPFAYAFTTVKNKPELVHRIISQLESKREVNVVILQKAEASWLAFKFEPVSTTYETVTYVREHFTKIRETAYFELYR